MNCSAARRPSPADSSGIVEGEKGFGPRRARHRLPAAQRSRAHARRSRSRTAPLSACVYRYMSVVHHIQECAQSSAHPTATAGAFFFASFHLFFPPGQRKSSNSAARLSSAVKRAGTATFVRSTAHAAPCFVTGHNVPNKTRREAPNQTMRVQRKRPRAMLQC